MVENRPRTSQAVALEARRQRQEEHDELYTEALQLRDAAAVLRQASRILQFTAKAREFAGFCDATALRGIASVGVAAGLGALSWVVSNINGEAGFVTNAALLGTGGVFLGDRMRLADRFDEARSKRKAHEAIVRDKKYSVAYFLSQYDDVLPPSELRNWWNGVVSEEYLSDPRHDVIKAYFERYKEKLPRKERRGNKKFHEDRAVRNVMLYQVRAMRIKLQEGRVRKEEVKNLINYLFGTLAAKDVGYIVSGIINAVITVEKIEGFADSVADDTAAFGVRFFIGPVRKMHGILNRAQSEREPVKTQSQPVKQQGRAQAPGNVVFLNSSQRAQGNSHFDHKTTHRR